MFLLSRTMSRRAFGLALAYHRRTYIYIYMFVRDTCPQRRDRWAETGGQEQLKEKSIGPTTGRNVLFDMLLLVVVVVVDLLMLLLFLMLYQWRCCYCWCCCCSCCSCRCCSCCCNCRRRCCAFISFYFHMAGHLPLDKTCFVFFRSLFLFFSNWSRGGLPFLWYSTSFYWTDFDLSIIVDRSCALLASRERRKDQARSKRSTSAVFLFLGGR